MRLHRHETGPVLQVGDVLCLRELPYEHAARADVARLAHADHVVEGLHRLLDRRSRIPAMDLVEVDVVHVEPRQGRVDGRQDVLAGESSTVLARSHRHEDLGRHHHLVASEELGQQAAGRHLARPLRVGVGRVEEGDATLDGGADDRFPVVLVEHPRPVAVVAEAHHPEADPRDPQAGPSQVHVLHGHPLSVPDQSVWSPRSQPRARRPGAGPSTEGDEPEVVAAGVRVRDGHDILLTRTSGDRPS